ncbi:MAG TPA: hypothetical protein VI356_08165 [Myxococcales bacterium]
MAPAISARSASDAEVTKFLAWRRHEIVEQTRAFVGSSEAEWRTRHAQHRASQRVLEKGGFLPIGSAFEETFPNLSPPSAPAFPLQTRPPAANVTNGAAVTRISTMASPKPSAPAG